MDQPNVEHEWRVDDIGIVTGTQVHSYFWVICIYSFVGLGFDRGCLIKVRLLSLINFNYSKEKCAYSKSLLLYHLFNMKFPLCFIVNEGNIYTSLWTPTL